VTRTRPAVLLLHGQPGGAADWTRVIRRLGTAVETIAVDRPGWDGHSQALDLEGNAGAALEHLDARGVDRAIIVGHSLGAAIAAWLAASHPRRTSALVLCAPAANRDALYPVDRWLAAPVAGELSSALMMGGLGLAVSLPALRRQIARRLELEPDYLRGARRALLAPAAWRAYAAEQRSLIADLPALEARLAQIGAPTTILAGTGDRIVPLRAQRELAAQIPQARLLTRRGAGHMLPQTRPEFVGEAILAALDPPPGSTLGDR
jgi:pimeloyl-ACP methyl ester carboxylesterase